MKKLIGESKGSLLNLIGLILMAELLLKIDNKLIQTLGVILTPCVFIIGFLLLKNDSRNIGLKKEEQ